MDSIGALRALPLNQRPTIPKAIVRTRHGPNYTPQNAPFPLLPPPHIGDIRLVSLIWFLRSEFLTPPLRHPGEKFGVIPITVQNF